MKSVSLCIIFIALITLFSSLASAQQNVEASSLIAAKELSANTGRPILAIAGRKT